MILKLDDLIVSAQETLKGALRRMTQNHKGVLFVCDEHLHLIGALSDGDVRRTLLDETLLVAPVSKAMNIDPIAATTTEKAKELLHRYSAVAVPVVDGQGHVRQILIEDKDGLKILECDTPPGGADEGADGKLNAVAIVPARGGSKRIPRKNLAVAGGRSLRPDSFAEYAWSRPALERWPPHSAFHQHPRLPRPGEYRTREFSDRPCLQSEFASRALGHLPPARQRRCNDGAAPWLFQWLWRRWDRCSSPCSPGRQGASHRAESAARHHRTGRR